MSAEPMTTGRVLRLAWPVMVSMLSYSVMSAADAVFVGRLGTAPLAAIGLSVTAVWLFIGLPYGILRGVRVATSQAVGAERHAIADALGWQTVWIALGMGVFVAVLSVLGPWVFDALGATPAVADEALRYFRVRVIAAPIALLELGLTAWFEGRGDTKTPMRVNVTANVLNIVLTASLVPFFGIAGAAWAGVFSLGLAAAWLFAYAWPILRTARWRPRRALLSESARLGLPIGTQRLLDILAWTILTGVLASIGDVELAAHVLAIRVLLVSFLPGMAIGEATAVLVGQSVGAGRPQDARAAWRSGSLAAIAVMLLGGAVFVLIPDLVMAPFHPEPEVAAIARRLLLVAAAFQLIDALATVTYLSLDGAGDTRFTLVASLALSWGVKLPVGIWCATSSGMGAVGAWLGLTAELVVLLVVLGWRWRSGRWYAGAVAA